MPIAKKELIQLLKKQDKIKVLYLYLRQLNKNDIDDIVDVLMKFNEFNIDLSNNYFKDDDIKALVLKLKDKGKESKHIISLDISENLISDKSTIRFLIENLPLTRITFSLISNENYLCKNFVWDGLKSSPIAREKFLNKLDGTLVSPPSLYSLSLFAIKSELLPSLNSDQGRKATKKIMKNFPENIRDDLSATLPIDLFKPSAAKLALQGAKYFIAKKKEELNNAISRLTI